MPKPKSALCNYDMVWYWTGGTDSKVGYWRGVASGYQGTLPSGGSEYFSVDDLYAYLEKEGWTARRGALSIGPPEGPP